jgi:hypothetical protein
MFLVQAAVSGGVAWLLIAATLPSARRLFARRWTSPSGFVFAALCLLPAALVACSLALLLPAGSRAGAVAANTGGVLACLGCLAALADAFVEVRRRSH